MRRVRLREVNVGCLGGGTGLPSLLGGLDKLYAIQPTADSGFCQQGSEAAPLPIVLDQVERALANRTKFAP